jgi:hypothetical protein
MIKQTLTWTALPKSSNGPNQTGTELRLSVLVSPRLWNDDTAVTTMPLGDFPDWLDWPALIGQASFQVEFDGGPALAATPENVDLRSDLWQALFKPTTTVRPFAFEDLSGAILHSFPAGTILDTVTGVYQRAAIDAGWGAGADLPGRAVLANDPDLADIARPVEPLPPWEPPETDRGPVFVGDKEEPGDEDEEENGTGEEEGEGPGGCRRGCLGCLTLPFQLLQRLLGSLGLNVVALPLAAEPLDPGGAAGPEAWTERATEAPAEPAATAALAAASQQQAAFDQLHDYLQPDTPSSVALPTQSEIEDEYDFHQMIASLGDYPNLMRRTGLVVDLVVTLGSDLPDDQGAVKVTATLPLATTTTHAAPRTRYDLGTERFMARPRAGSELCNGLLRLDDASRFRVAMTDVAGSGLKLQNTATNMRGMTALAAWPANAPEEAGLPSLQTVGISVIRQEQTLELVRRFDHAFALNGFLSALDASPMPAYAGSGPPPAPSDELFAEDLVRGYRVDVHDDRANAWHSLCRRLGDYQFLDDPLSLLDEEDEGFVQLASTESLADSPQRELKVHESLFTWDGWSLAAARPGDTILADHTTGEVENTAVTQFQLETSFRALPGSLPRLRFGWNYRLRARMVDLAGNSVFGPEDAAFADTQPETSAPFQCDRYEPVAPPALVLRDSPVEGETIERLVIRSTIDDSPVTLASLASERHIVPPKTSQQMAERHGIFDATPGMRKDQAAYDLASREAGSVTERMNFGTGTLEPIPGIVKEEPSPGRVYWLQTNDTFEIAFLPDPFARGVLLLGLPGMAGPDDVVDGTNRIAFTGTWPDLEPFRLRLTGLPAGAVPAPPGLAGRVLTVQVPQGEVFKVRYSSYFHTQDLEQMGVWQWVRQAAPAHLADLEKQATDGRNWLHLPFRELYLVHAVQQPLAIPVASQFAIAPDKKPGDTAVTLGGTSRVLIDAKSTGKIDLRAAWTDPFDDPGKPSYDPLTDIVQREMHVAEIAARDAADDQLEVEDVVHAIGDTKYHRVTYTPIATTRYLENFPPAVLANPEDLVRPTPAEIGSPAALNARIELDIPNSARPDAVPFRYSLPVVQWSRSENAGVVTRVRRGGGLRIYMERPWFSSGDKELLGVVLRPSKYAPLSEDWKTLRKYVSEWGMDPIWRAEETAPLEQSDFVNAVAQAGGLTLEELPGFDVGVAGFATRYDSQRNLWFADIALDAERHYFPFVRLALARYHPISVADAHLSRVVLSDFMQVLPDRTVEYDLTQVGGSGLVQLRVHGPAYHHPRDKPYASPLMIARLERRLYDTGDELGWEVVGTAPLPTTQQQVAETVWEGRLQLPSPAPSPARIVVLEAEIHGADPTTRRATADSLEERIFPISRETGTGSLARFDNIAARVVFADAIELP